MYVCVCWGGVTYAVSPLSSAIWQGSVSFDKADLIPLLGFVGLVAIAALALQLARHKSVVRRH